MTQFQHEASGSVFRAFRAPAPRSGRGGPSRWQLFSHPRRSFRLLRALLGDPHVPWVRKALFVWLLVILGAVLLVPDAGSELVSTVVPVLGNLLDIPVDASLDWTAAVLLLPTLFRVFPADVVWGHWLQLTETNG
ncbi:MAG: hypothetical protein M1118_01325 [Chloroflexi bacterium]|nr:hypothetical protein [Chloroflexota bacterium]